MPSGPRKYLETTTLVAVCDHVVGISTSFCSKKALPLSSAMTAVRYSHSSSSKGSSPERVKKRSTVKAVLLTDLADVGLGLEDHGRRDSFPLLACL